jgi:hypothetical protein
MYVCLVAQVYSVCYATRKSSPRLSQPHHCSHLHSSSSHAYHSDKGIFIHHNRDLSSAFSPTSLIGSSITSSVAAFFASLKAFGSLRNDSSPENFLLVRSRKHAQLVLCCFQALVAVLEQAMLSPPNCSFSMLKSLLITQADRKCAPTAFERDGGILVQMHACLVKGEIGYFFSYQPRSSPFSRKEQSPFTFNVQPPCTPRPLRQLMSGTMSGLLGSHFCAVASRGSEIPAPSVPDVAEPLVAGLRSNFEKAHVKHLKSSAHSSSGMSPVSARPMAIMLAAWVQIRRVRGPEGSASSRWMSSFRQYAMRSWSCGMLSPLVEGTTIGSCSGARLSGKC